MTSSLVEPCACPVCAQADEYVCQRIITGKSLSNRCWLPQLCKKPKLQPFFSLFCILFFLLKANPSRSKTMKNPLDHIIVDQGDQAFAAQVPFK